MNVDAASFAPQSSTSLYVAANKSVLLQTAQTTLQNPNQPMICQDVHAVLDLGSQRSYITERAAGALSLRSQEVIKLSILTFGSSDHTLSECQVVRVLLGTREGGMELRLLTTPSICEPLTAQPVTLCANVYQHLSNLELAYPSDGSAVIEVDLLIGSDYYWELVTGRISRGEDGPVAVETKLGWVLSGPAPEAESACSLLTTHTLRVDAHEEVGKYHISIGACSGTPSFDQKLE